MTADKRAMQSPYDAPESRLPHAQKKAVFDVLFSFEGRINRRDFWLGLALIVGSAAVINVVFGQIPRLSPWSYALNLLTFYPLFALSAKRYHDQGSSGWMSLIWLAPLVGWMFAIIECGFGKGTPMRNKYGAPLYGPLVDLTRTN